MYSLTRESIMLVNYIQLKKNILSNTTTTRENYAYYDHDLVTRPPYEPIFVVTRVFFDHYFNIIKHHYHILILTTLCTKPNQIFLYHSYELNKNVPYHIPPYFVSFLSFLTKRQGVFKETIDDCLNGIYFLY